MPEKLHRGDSGDKLHKQGYSISTGFIPFGLSFSDIAEGRAKAYLSIELTTRGSKKIDALQLFDEGFYPRLGFLHGRTEYVIGSKGIAKISKGNNGYDVDVLTEGRTISGAKMVGTKLDVSFGPDAQNQIRILDSHMVSSHPGEPIDLGQVQAIWVQSHELITPERRNERFGFTSKRWAPFYTLDFFAPTGVSRDLMVAKNILVQGVRRVQRIFS